VRELPARRAWLVAFVVVNFLSFPHPIAGRVLDLGLFVSWLSPAFLILGLRGLAPRAAGRTGFVWGLVAHSAILHWIYVVTVTYGHAPAVVGWIAPVLLACYSAIAVSLFAAAAAWLARRGASGPLALALLWTAVDHARSFALSGWPWATIGYAQHENTLLLGWAAWGGVYALSFWTVLVGAGLAAAWPALRTGSRPPLEASIAMAAGIVAHAMGPLLAPPELPADAPRLRVAALQGNIDQGAKWDPDWALRTRDVYADLTREAVAAGAEIVVWPETAMPTVIELQPELWDWLSGLAEETGATLIVGAVGATVDPAVGHISHFYDSAFVFAGDGEFLGRYDKSHLVPFGEYVPLRALLGRFFAAVASGIAASDVSPGAGPRAFALGDPTSGERPTLVGVPICYELLFPDLVRRFVADGAGVLFAMTNDAWYGRTGAPYQFLAMTSLRSAETGIWTVRAANTGVSAVIDETGRVRQQTPIFERDWLVADVPLRLPEAQMTFYARHGDVFAAACWIGIAAIAAVAALRSRGIQTLKSRQGKTTDE